MKDMAAAQKAESTKGDVERDRKLNEEIEAKAAKEATAAFAAQLKAKGPVATIADDKVSVTVYTASSTEVCGFTMTVVPVASSIELPPVPPPVKAEPVKLELPKVDLPKVEPIKKEPFGLVPPLKAEPKKPTGGAKPNDYWRDKGK
jgi:hypothetical protein